ncbi:unnamed protein product, partial [Pylaiella littoralis]
LCCAIIHSKVHTQSRTWRQHPAKHPAGEPRGDPAREGHSFPKKRVLAGTREAGHARNGAAAGTTSRCNT